MAGSARHRGGPFAGLLAMQGQFDEARRLCRKAIELGRNRAGSSSVAWAAR